MTASGEKSSPTSAKSSPVDEESKTPSGKSSRVGEELSSVTKRIAEAERGAGALGAAGGGDPGSHGPSGGGGPSSGGSGPAGGGGDGGGAPFVTPGLVRATSIPAEFKFGEVLPAPRITGAPPPTPGLGPLAAFTGNWQGKGFNTIFRPDNPVSASSEKLPRPLPPTDNILELNLTAETLSFSSSLGSVPNRGRIQEDIFLNGVPYLQSIQDVTTGPPVAIHLEPGLWMAVPPTKAPAEGPTLARMASIPHGTTICAQGTSRTFAGAPTIPAVDITPFIAGSSIKIRFESQEAADADTRRIPQDLTPFISAGTITQAILNDPNTVLRNSISGLDILTTTEISISTSPGLPLFGGGADNIAFLLGDSAAITNPHGPGQNAQSVQMNATFWIEEVLHRIILPVFKPGQPPLELRPEAAVPGHPTPTFMVRPPIPIDSPRSITLISTQIQYSQTVELNFEGLTWPHVSVATLVPAGPIPGVPPGGWS